MLRSRLARGLLRRRRRLFATTMAQGELGDRVDILLGDGARTAPCGMGPGGAQPDQIGAQAIDAGGKATLGDLRQCCIVEGDARQCAARVLATFAQGLLLAFPTRRRNRCGSLSKSSRRRMICPRSVGAVWPLRATFKPKRSSNCGRSSPSSGFMVPISTNFAECRWEMPSRSIRLVPLAATSSSRSTR